MVEKIIKLKNKEIFMEIDFESYHYHIRKKIGKNLNKK
jgi:hypothetical protein